MESEVATNLYPTVRDALLSSHPWNFATAQMRLAKLTAEPLADFAFAFQLPADFLRALSTGTDVRGGGAEYRIAERRLSSNLDDIILTYMFRPDEKAFPPFFDHVLIARLAAEFCIPLTESTSRAETLMRVADTELRRARLVDSQQDYPGRLRDFSLIEARN